MAERNDHPGSATPIVIATPGGTYSVSGLDNLAYRKDPNEQGNMGSGPSGPDGSAWWRYKPLASGTLSLSGVNVAAISGGSTDAEIWSWSGPEDAGFEQELTLITSAGGDSLAGNRPAHSFSVTAGVTYYIKMFAWAGQRMSYALDATGPASDTYPSRPAGALISTAVTADLPSGTYASSLVDNRAYGEEIGETFPFPEMQRTAWWVYKPNASGSATFDTFASDQPSTPASTPKSPNNNPDTEIAVYSAAGPATVMTDLTLLASQEDSLISGGPIGQFRGGKVTVSVTAGTTYYVQVGAYTGYHILYKLAIAGPVTAPPTEARLSALVDQIPLVLDPATIDARVSAVAVQVPVVIAPSTVSARSSALTVQVVVQTKRGYVTTAEGYPIMIWADGALRHVRTAG